MQYNKLLDLYIKSIDAQIKYMVIFGAGILGEILKGKFDASNVKIDYFCDNDVNKQGTKIGGIDCISFHKLKEYSDSAIIFISPKYELRKEICRQLIENGMKYIFPEELLELIESSEKRISLFPIGHYYSLYPDFDAIENKADIIFDKKKYIHDINFNEEQQLKTLGKMVELYLTIPAWKDVADKRSEGLRYNYLNGYYTMCDAVALHCFLRMLKPNRVIEIGSGYSSAVMLDTNEYYLNNSIELSFIEPYPDRLRTLLKSKDRIDLQVKELQDIPLDCFKRLEADDILFIDSSHVSKINSDVNYLFFEIFPILSEGVYIHIHDIFYPFEYPKEWILQSERIWNEIYLLRAFLQNNRDYSIQFFQNMLELKYSDLFMSKWSFPVAPHGSSIWLKKQGV